MLVTTRTFTAQLVESLDATLAESNEMMKDSERNKQKKGLSRDIKLIWANNRRKFNQLSNHWCQMRWVHFGKSEET